jgi:hypothetical protein
MITRDEQLYRLFAASGELLYVGISISTAGRMGQHRAAQPWWSDVARIEVESLPGMDRRQALEHEAAVIIAERPLHNVVHSPRRQPRPTPPSPRPLRRTSGPLFDGVETVPEVIRSPLRGVARRVFDGQPMSSEDADHAQRFLNWCTTELGIHPDDAVLRLAELLVAEPRNRIGPVQLTPPFGPPPETADSLHDAVTAPRAS